MKKMDSGWTSWDWSNERGDFEERNWCWSMNIEVLRSTWDGTHVGNNGHTWGLEWWTCGFTIISRFEHRGTSTSTENPSRKIVPHNHMWIHSDRNSPSLHQNIPHFTPALFRGKHGPGLEHLHCLWMWRSWQFRWVATGSRSPLSASFHSCFEVSWERRLHWGLMMVHG